MTTEQRLAVAYTEALRVQRSWSAARVHIAVGSAVLDHLKSLVLTEDARPARFTVFGFPIVELGEDRQDDIEVVATVAIRP